MPAPVNREEFLDLVRRSEVLEGELLDSFARKLTDSGTALDQPKSVADRMIQDGLLTVFQAKQILAGKWRRFRLSGKYKILELIGAGGMGSVYLCEHVFMKRHVALKILPTDKLEDDKSSLERFYREARAAGKLDHPNIVRAYDIDQDGKVHFLVMEYVDGESLQNIVAKHGRMDPIRAAHYIRQAAIGLQHAHEAGLVHRDIKPGNLLVDRAGTVKILDLGLARILDARKDNVTEKYDDGAVLGTADYLAPEQAMGGKTPVDIRADIYSLGATFFFLLAGRAPFEDGTLTQKLLWHQIRKIQSITDYRDDVPPRMAAVIEKMLTKSPDERFATPQAVADALAEWTGEPIGPPPASWIPKRSLAALTPGAQGDAPVVPMNATPRSTVNRVAPRTPRPASSTPPPKSSLSATVAPRVVVEREAPGPRLRARRRARDQRKMIVQIIAGSTLSLSIIFFIVWLATRKSDTTSSPPPNVPPPVAIAPPTSPPVVSSAPAPAVSTPQAIRADQAKDHVGANCIVEMVVRNTGDNHQGRYFLNSLSDFHDPNCFTATFTKPVLEQLKKRGVNDLRSFFQNRTIRVVGTITRYTNPDGRISTQIDVKNADQIQF